MDDTINHSRSTMTSTSPALTVPPQGVRDVLSGSVRPKFNSYFSFTKANQRSVVTGTTPDGKPIFTYSDESMVPDIMVLLSLFGEMYEAFVTATANLADRNAALAAFFAADPTLVREIRRLLEEGEYWESAAPGTRTLIQVPLVAAVPGRLPEISQVLRNGSAHFHWRYENLSAQDYWVRQGWDVGGHHSAFGLMTRAAVNYKAYIVDATPPWNSARFWDMRNLRILVTQFTVLRYHLHTFFNILLNGRSEDVFGHPI
jgi:hypothetical protein